MAKPFYSIDEVCLMLGKDQEQIRAMVRQGALREFRDAGKIFFKAEDVDKLRGGASKEDTGEITLEPADTEPSYSPDQLPGLSDTPLSGSGSGSGMISLEPVDEETQKPKKEGTVVSASGIGVFDDDELEIDADPMAKTHITTGAVGDKIGLEGSGLLDLQREADDTSLGAELLDEIYPGEEEAPPAQRSAVVAAPAAEEEPEAEAAVEAVAPEPESLVMRTTAGDPAEGMFGGLLVGVLLVLATTGSVAAALFQGFLPDYARLFSNQFWFLLGGAALVPILTLLVGWLVGRMTAGRA
ncbi:MAG: helix-turn-helix domain-containing protein [Phycisphaerae bacterium]|jgi:hypothetical protein